MNTPSTAGPAAISVRGLRVSYGGPDVLRGVDLDVAPGSVVALLGPSGCGKTTLLRSIAGLERPIDGEVRIADRVVFGPGAHVAPEARRVGMVFQDWALFPHLSVAANVGYGLPRAERRGPRVHEALAMVGLAGLGQRAPGTLSGGQQQRVALARAIAPRPRVLLLDEPFSNLDTALRVEVRAEVHQLLVELGITTVFVTHDQEEAFVLGDDVAVMQEGTIVQQASPAELYDRPVSPWVAHFVGDANLIAGDADGTAATTSIGAVNLRQPLSGPVEVLLRPEELHLEAASARDGAAATVDLVEYYGHDCVIFARLPDGAVLRARSASAPRFARGDAVTVSYAGGPAVAYPRTGSAAPGEHATDEAPDDTAPAGIPAAPSAAR